MKITPILATKLLNSNADFEKVRIAINGILPSSMGDWWCITMEKKEVIKFRGHQIQTMMDSDQIVVPFFKGLPKNYRVKFPDTDGQLAKVTLDP